MPRISLVEQYNNKDVVSQIYDLRDRIDGYDESIDRALHNSSEALSVSQGFQSEIASVTSRQDRVDDMVSDVRNDMDVLESQMDVSVEDLTTDIRAQDLTGMTVNTAGVGKFNVIASRSKGNVVSNTFDVSKVTSARLANGALTNSFYVEMTLSDGSVIRSSDAVFDITGVEADVHVTGCTLHEGENDHSLYLTFDMNNGSSFRSNTINYDYPNVASTTVPGLVMSGLNEGEVQITATGIPSVIGYQTLKSQVNDHTSAIMTNAQNIETNKNDIKNIEQEIGSDGSQGSIRGEIADLKNKDDDLNTKITTNSTDISNVQDDLTQIQNDVTGLKLKDLIQTQVTLPSTRWVLNSSNVYYQEVTPVGLTADAILFVSPAPSSYDEYGYSGVRATQVSDQGALRFEAKVEPTVALAVNLAYNGVSS